MFHFMACYIMIISGEKEGPQKCETIESVFVTRKSYTGVVLYYSQFNHPVGQNKQGWVLVPVLQLKEKHPN